MIATLIMINYNKFQNIYYIHTILYKEKLKLKTKIKYFEFDSI